MWAPLAGWSSQPVDVGQRETGSSQYALIDEVGTVPLGIMYASDEGEEVIATTRRMAAWRRSNFDRLLDVLRANGGDLVDPGCRQGGRRRRASAPLQRAGAVCASPVTVLSRCLSWPVGTRSRTGGTAGCNQAPLMGRFDDWVTDREIHLPPSRHLSPIGSISASAISIAISSGRARAAPANPASTCRTPARWQRSMR